MVFQLKIRTELSWVRCDSQSAVRGKFNTYLDISDSYLSTSDCTQRAFYYFGHGHFNDQFLIVVLE